ncbi:MAG: MFS transporter [Gammaproteobacteria bacterium]|nr:MFS transporter [Gammaproteobacteria bacterium]
MRESGTSGGRTQVVAWALYDWANSAFATVVMSGFFPVFFRDYWNAGEAGEAITFRLGVTNSLSSLVIVLCAPVLGAIADAGGSRKTFPFAFASLGILSTASLYGVSQGAWMVAAIAYFLATVGFMGGNIFYDALLVTVAPRSRYETVSALGFGLGYLGGGLLFAACVGMSLNPDLFGLENAGEAVRVAFVLVALWWAVFSIPLFRRVTEPPAGDRRRSWSVG